MIIVMSIFVGGILGWVCYSFLGFNERRGLMVSIIIGMAGGFLGGQVIAPMFTTAAAVPGELNSSAVLFAVGAAATFLAVGHLVHNRWGL